MNVTDLSNYHELPFRDLSIERRVRKTLGVIAAGAKQFIRDGIPFRNRERRLPNQLVNYYREYTVSPMTDLGSRGAERLIVGNGGEIYYTPDHYNSFVRIR